MSKRFVGAAKQKDVEKALEDTRPLLVLYYKEGCPYCEGNEKAWNEAKNEADENVNIIEVESEAIPETESDEIEGFPTMIYKEGSTKKKTTGQKNSGEEILTELEVPKKKGKKAGRRLRRTRGRTLRRAFGRRNRKLGYRTLRHDIPFV